MNKTANAVLPVRRILSTTLALVLVLALMASFGVTPALAQAQTFKDNVRVPFELFVFVPCAAGGAGEVVYLSGPLHILFVTTIDSNGGFHAKTHFQPQGVSGFGETTGAKYQATGVTQDHFNGKVGATYTFVNNFKIIGQGPNNNFLIHETFHFTINAKGQVTAEIQNIKVKCQ
jgi:hypothetical protein